MKSTYRKPYGSKTFRYTYAVSVLAEILDCFILVNLSKVKRIFNYLKGTEYYELFYPRGSAKGLLKVFVNAYFAILKQDVQELSILL